MIRDFKTYRKELSENREVIKVIKNGVLSVDACIESPEKLGYRIIKI